MKLFFYKYGAKMFCYLIVVFTPIVPSLLFLGFFVAMDLLTGILRSRKAGFPITSKKMSQTVTKLVLYYIAIICSHILDTQFLDALYIIPKITRLVTGFIVVIEFKSIIENISGLLGLPVWDLIKDKIYRAKND